MRSLRGMGGARSEYPARMRWGYLYDTGANVSKNRPQLEVRRYRSGPPARYGARRIADRPAYPPIESPEYDAIRARIYNGAQISPDLIGARRAPSDIRRILLIICYRPA